jgi:hypothetical protein
VRIEARASASSGRMGRMVVAGGAETVMPGRVAPRCKCGPCPEARFVLGSDLTGWSDLSGQLAHRTRVL